MTRPDRILDFTSLTYRQREVPEGLPPLGKYKPLGKNDTVVIDTGSWQYRAGYASKDLPALVFDPLVHRYQDKAGESTQFHVGRGGPSGVARVSGRTPYEDGSVILNAPTLEHILDDIFYKLNIHSSEESVLHPIFMTEVVANPPYCRKECSELLFEAYGVQKLAYGVDGMLAWHANNSQSTKDPSSLVISIGNYSTVITAIINGRVRPENVRRINFGGNTVSQFMLQLLQCKYPTFPVKMSLWQAQEVAHRACKVAMDYDKTLEEFCQDNFLSLENFTVQFPYSTETLAEKLQKEVAREELAVKRREQAQKLRERAEKQRNEKLEAKRQQLESMRKLAKQVTATSLVKPNGDFDDEEEERTLGQLRLFGYESLEELQTAIDSERKELDRMMGIEEPKEAPDYSLVDIPDSNLSPDQIKEKRKQRLLKNSADARERLKKEKEEEERRAKVKMQLLEKRRLEDFKGWRQDLYDERQALIKKIKLRQKKKEALADRKSHAAGARLRNVVSLVDDGDQDEITVKSTKKRKSLKKDSTLAAEDAGFGDNDADWLVYRQISRDEEAEGEEEEGWQRRLAEIEEELEKYDCDAFYDIVAAEMSMNVTILDKLSSGGSLGKDNNDPNAVANQLNVNVERFRAVEGLFQPGAILGLDQAGLMEAIEDLLKSFSLEERELLSRNVFITGGASQTEGLTARIERELTMIQPTNSKIGLSRATEPSLDAWKGAAILCRNDQASNKNNSIIPWITKEWYEEHGGDRLPGKAWFTNQF